MKNPEVSIIIPTYNREEVIERAIKSALNQSFQDFEIIVVDDRSKDNTKKVVKSIDDPRINFIEHNQNKGGSAARNTGIKHAKGKYVAFLDSDDEWLPEKLEKQVDKLKNSSEETGVIYTRYWIVKGNRKFLSKKPKKEGNIFKDQLFEDYVTPTSCVLAKKDCLNKVDGFDENLPARQDYDIWLRVSKHCNFNYLEEPLVKIYHDPDPEKITTRSAQKQIEAEKIILNKVKEEINNWPKSEQKRCIARHYFILGRRLCSNGEMKLGKRYFKKALKTSWGPRHFIFLLISSLGSKTYRFLLKCYRRARTIFG